MTVKEYAIRHNLNEDQVRYMIRRGKIRAKKVEPYYDRERGRPVPEHYEILDPEREPEEGEPEKADPITEEVEKKEHDDLEVNGRWREKKRPEKPKERDIQGKRHLSEETREKEERDIVGTLIVAGLLALPVAIAIFLRKKY